MTREQAWPYVSFGVDDALALFDAEQIPADRVITLVGWQCGFEPMFVAVWSYLNVRIEAEEATELATDALVERKWFSGEPSEPDYIILEEKAPCG
jgi:hypothetical protein